MLNISDFYKQKAARKTALLFVNLLLTAFIFAQKMDVADYTKYGTLLRLSLQNAPFPDSARREGHDHAGKHYDFKGHYDDSTVLVFVPDYFKAERRTDFVVHFHGWFNNVDSSAAFFRLIEQFHAARCNAVLVLPQGPKDAPDSYGGKLEGAGVFKKLLSEISENLFSKKMTPSVSVPQNVILSGHSGAYRVISNILLHGGVPIREVYLFDGLYGQLEKYAHWLTTEHGRFINIFTDNGGTLDNSRELMRDLQAWRVPFVSVEEKAVSDGILQQNRLIFIHSALQHNEVVGSQQQFFHFLSTSSALQKR